MDLIAFFLFIYSFLSPLSVVGVDVAILAHAVGVEFVMRAVPWLLVSAIPMVAVSAQAFSVVLFIRMSAFIHLLTR